MATLFRQAQIRIILTQQQAIFCSRGHHTIRLIRPLRNQIIYQNTDIGFVAAQHQGLLTLNLHHGINASHQALCCRFLVATGAIGLARTKQAANSLMLQGILQLQRI